MYLHCGNPLRSFLFAASALVGATLCTLQPALAKFVQQGTKLVGTGGASNALQGIAVSVSADGNTAIVGGSNDSPTGAAWIFTRSGGTWSQQGTKLVGSDNVGNANQGFSVALSADGNTAIVGGYTDNTNVGAAWVFTRSGATWTQQGPKLVAIGAVGAAEQGFSVGLSADGNTAIIGGPFDNNKLGAAWIFTRSSGTWIQGPKLTGNDAAGTQVFQGWSVALSADGNTAIVGGTDDSVGAGAAWVFTRNGANWIQEANKLYGSGASGTAAQGYSVALSADGNTAIVGGTYDNSRVGAAWIFTRSGGAWSQQGNKLVGNDAVGIAQQGWSVSLSGDGNTALVGGPLDNSLTGASWVYTRSAGVWNQQGPKLVSSDIVGAAHLGWSVAVSDDSKTAVIGGPYDNSAQGAMWAFVQSPAAHDFNADGMSDILWRDSSGNVAMWLMNGGAVSSASVVGNVPLTWSIVGQRDFNGDGPTDILWTDASGNVAIWLMNGASIASSTLVGNVGTSWSVAGTGDFNSDGKGDILWRDTGGNVAVWLMNGAAISSAILVANVPTNWSIVGSRGNAILWRDNAGDLALWKMNGGAVASAVSLGNVASNWSIVGAGDFDGDGNTDILWRDSSGNTSIWLLNSTGQVTSNVFVANVPTSWSIVETGDFNGDGKSDILWRDTSGNTAIWMMNGGTISSAVSVANVPTTWTVQGANAD
jgi:FG-GAP-like repeat